MLESVPSGCIRRQQFSPSLIALLTLLPLVGCYSLTWSHAPSGQLEAPPDSVAALFRAHEDGKIWHDLEAPGKRYGFDPGEKDRAWDSASRDFQLSKLSISLHDRTPPKRVVADLTFHDASGNTVKVPSVDLLRMVPKIETRGDLQYAELLLEEYTRHGVTFRRELSEFVVETANPEAKATADRAYRVVLSNNCLDPQKFEVAVTTTDFSDFDNRLASGLNVNQDRTLSHSWFYLDQALYQQLIKLKNPDLTADLSLSYDYKKLSNRAEEVRIDWDQLRQIRVSQPVEVVEIGSRSGRKLEPVDVEQHYKWSQGLFVNRDELSTYTDVLKRPVELAEYSDRGFYFPDKPKVFDYSWAQGLDQVRVSTVENPRARTVVEITVEGEGAPYAVRVGNIDLANLDEQSLSLFSFGFNMYPVARRHTPRQATLAYDQDLMPADQQPYLLLYDKASDRFLNNQLKGLDRVLLGWDGIDRSVLDIYLISYERILPVWTAKVRLNDELVDRARVRRFVYGG